METVGSSPLVLKPPFGRLTARNLLEGAAGVGQQTKSLADGAGKVRVQGIHMCAHVSVCIYIYICM